MKAFFSFKYSPRPWTKAKFHENQIPEEEKSRRLHILQSKHKSIAFLQARKYKGQVLDVLVEKEDRKTGWFMGRSTHNKLVYFAGHREDMGHIVPVKITKTNAVTFYGEKVL